MSLALPIDPVSSRIIAIERSTALLLLDVARDPLRAVPAEAFEVRMVVARNLGHARVYLSDPVLIHEALVRNAEHLEKSEDMKRVLGTALGDGLLSSDGPTWRWQRQALAPAFQHERLADLTATMIVAAEATRDRWLAMGAGASIDLGHEMMRTTFAVIVETMLAGPEGLDVRGVERSLSSYLRATPWMFALAMLDAPRWVPFPGRGRAMASIRTMRRAVLERVVARRSAGPAPGDLISMLLAAVDPESGRRLDDEAIVDNILTFIAAGHETTALALTWTFALLARHPDCLVRLLAEIDAVTGGAPVAPEHIGDLAYARQVISEAMRLYPPAPVIARSVRRAIEIGGVAVSEGAVVFVPIYAVHRHKHLWPNADAFDPDRFAPAAVKTRHRFAYLPFGVGPRVCIGNSFAMTEAVAILAVLAQAVMLEPIDVALPRARMQVTLRPARPLRMRVAPR